MKAIITTRYGGPEVLELRDVDKPSPQDDEILVRIHAATVTAGDIRMRKFDIPPSFWVPARLAFGVTKPRNKIPGMEFSGVVEAVGKNVTQVKPGDELLAATGTKFGSYADYLCLTGTGQNQVMAKKSAEISHADAATLPIGARTALYFLREANVQPGQKVLIYGASGSLGTFAVQLAKLFGAEVTGVCSGRNVELVKSLGADVVIDYTEDDFAQQSVIYDVVFDTVGKASMSDCLSVLQEKGVYLQAVGAPSTMLRMRLAGMSNEKTLVGGEPPFDPEDLVYLQSLVAEGKLKPVIDKTYSLEDVVAAHQYVETGRKRGNVVLMVKESVA